MRTLDNVLYPHLSIGQHMAAGSLGIGLHSLNIVRKETFRNYKINVFEARGSIVSRINSDLSPLQFFLKI